MIWKEILYVLQHDIKICVNSDNVNMMNIGKNSYILKDHN